jgi:hypothetical protein
MDKVLYDWCNYLRPIERARSAPLHGVQQCQQRSKRYSYLPVQHYNSVSTYVQRYKHARWVPWADIRDKQQQQNETSNGVREILVLKVVDLHISWCTYSCHRSMDAVHFYFYLTHGVNLLASTAMIGTSHLAHTPSLSASRSTGKGENKTRADWWRFVEWGRPPGMRWWPWTDWQTEWDRPMDLTLFVPPRAHVVPISRSR